MRATADGASSVVRMSGKAASTRSSPSSAATRVAREGTRRPASSPRTYTGPTTRTAATNSMIHDVMNEIERVAGCAPRGVAGKRPPRFPAATCDGVPEPEFGDDHEHEDEEARHGRTPCTPKMSKTAGLPTQREWPPRQTASAKGARRDQRPVGGGKQDHEVPSEKGGRQQREPRGGVRQGQEGEGREDPKTPELEAKPGTRTRPSKRVRCLQEMIARWRPMRLAASADGRAPAARPEATLYAAIIREIAARAPPPLQEARGGVFVAGKGA